MQFLQTLIEILFANIDITGLVLASLLENMAGDAAFQTKLLAEVRHEKKGVSSADVATYTSKQDTLLHYLTLESVRLVSHVRKYFERSILLKHSVDHHADFSPAELTGADKVISGYLIPAGTPVVLDVHRVNTHSSIWGDDALKFRPERYIDLSPSHWRYGLVRFGIASGRCLGKNMADVILKLVAISVIESYTLSRVESGKEGGAKGGLTAEVEFCRLESK